MIGNKYKTGIYTNIAICILVRYYVYCLLLTDENVVVVRVCMYTVVCEK